MSQEDNKFHNPEIESHDFLNQEAVRTLCGLGQIVRDSPGGNLDIDPRTRPTINFLLGKLDEITEANENPILTEEQLPDNSEYKLDPCNRRNILAGLEHYNTVISARRTTGNG